MYKGKTAREHANDARWWFQLSVLCVVILAVLLVAQIVLKVVG